MKSPLMPLMRVKMSDFFCLLVAMLHPLAMSDMKEG